MEKETFYAQLREQLSYWYDLDDILRIEPATGSLLCENFIVETASGKYFLKQYRAQISRWVHEIKLAERYFAEHDIPVILPTPDRDGRPSFWFDQNWYSVFPYVQGIQKTSAELTPDDLTTMGEMLGKIHRVGEAMPPVERQDMPLIKLWDRGLFELQFPELYRCVSSIKEPDAFDRLTLETMRRKREFVSQNTLTPVDLHLTSDCLLHGDFHQGNLFFNERGQITHVFDFEKTAIGPRAFELARSILISAFDNGLSDEYMDRARFFLKAYRDVFPIPFDECAKGVKAYLIYTAHQLWIESKRYFKGKRQFDLIYFNHAERVAHLQDDWEAFTHRLYD